MADTKKSLKDYDRWGSVGFKVISKPQQSKKKVKTTKKGK